MIILLMNVDTGNAIYSHQWELCGQSQITISYMFFLQEIILKKLKWTFIYMKYLALFYTINVF